MLISCRPGEEVNHFEYLECCGKEMAASLC